MLLAVMVSSRPFTNLLLSQGLTVAFSPGCFTILSLLSHNDAPEIEPYYLLFQLCPLCPFVSLEYEHPHIIHPGASSMPKGVPQFLAGLSPALYVFLPQTKFSAIIPCLKIFQ